MDEPLRPGVTSGRILLWSGGGRHRVQLKLSEDAVTPCKIFVNQGLHLPAY